MLITVLGATGPSGQHFVRTALSNGHRVRALVRNPDKMAFHLREDENLEIRDGVDIFDAENLAQGFAESDAVVSCLGAPVSLTPLGAKIELYSESMKAITDAMRKSATKRLLAISSWCTDDQPSYPFFIRWILKPLFIGRNLDDMRRMEEFLERECQDINYTVVRPPGLGHGGPTTDPILPILGGQIVPSKSPRKVMERGDLAKFMLEALSGGIYDRQFVAVAT